MLLIQVWSGKKKKASFIGRSTFREEEINSSSKGDWKGLGVLVIWATVGDYDQKVNWVSQFILHGDPSVGIPPAWGSSPSSQIPQGTCPWASGPISSSTI